MGNIIDSILAVLKADGAWREVAAGHLAPPQIAGGHGSHSLLFVRHDVVDIVVDTANCDDIAAIRRDARDGIVRAPPLFDNSGERQLFNHYRRIVLSQDDDQDRERALASLFTVALERHSLEQAVSPRVRALITLATVALGPMGEDRPYLNQIVRRTTGANLRAAAARAPRRDLDVLSPREIFHTLAELDVHERKLLAMDVAVWLAGEIIELADLYPFNREGVRFRPVLAPHGAISALALGETAAGPLERHRSLQQR